LGGGRGEGDRGKKKKKNLIDLSLVEKGGEEKKGKSEKEELFPPVLDKKREKGGVPPTSLLQPFLTHDDQWK